MVALWEVVFLHAVDFASADKYHNVSLSGGGAFRSPSLVYLCSTHFPVAWSYLYPLLSHSFVPMLASMARAIAISMAQIAKMIASLLVVFFLISIPFC